ncbi:hypothetical protein [Thermobrachium celere]|nr:hypothetical protein [Thermobrachium celere]
MGKLNYIFSFIMCIVPLYLINFTSFNLSFALLILVALNFLHKMFMFSDSRVDLSRWVHNYKSIPREDLKNIVTKIKELTFIFTMASVGLLFILNYIENSIGLRRIDNNIKIFIAKGIMVILFILIIAPDVISTYEVNKIEVKSTNPCVSRINTNRIIEKIKDIIS